MGNRKKFVDEYIKDFNSARAARVAGYPNPRESAIELLNDSEIRTLIKDSVAYLTDKNKANQDEVLHKLLKIANCDIGEFYDLFYVEEVNEQGEIVITDVVMRLKPKAETDTYLIQKIKMGRFGPEIELVDKKWALEMLSKYFGMINNKIDVGGGLTVKTSFADLVKELENA